ncbi:MAG: ABC transporter permease [Gemmatimonadota bacterium]|nr:ABC transporter permease [Gemmatimonadota bacterium]
MFWNYLKVAWRNLLRHPLYATINVVGLGIAISFCLLAFLFVRYEWTYDGFHENANRIYRIYAEFESRRTSDNTPRELGPALSETLPDVRSVRIHTGMRIVHDRGQTTKVNILQADPSILDVFSFPLIKGDPANALVAPNHVVITETMAATYFPGQDPIGKSISVQDVEPFVLNFGGGGSDKGDTQRAGQKEGPAGAQPAPALTDHPGEVSGARILSFSISPPSPDTRQEEQDKRPMQELTVTGVIRDIPRNSTLRFDFLSALSPAAQKREWNTVNTFVLLPEYLSPLEMERRLDGLSIPWPRSRQPEKLKLQALRDIYFDSGGIHTQVGSTSRISRPGNPDHSYILAGIAMLVLVVAAVNYTNLSVGRSFSRAREVGMRKVAGGLRTQLARQFLAESVLLTLIALALGLALAELFLPGFNSLISRKFSLSDLADTNSLAYLLVMALIVGVFAGGYPALFMSGFFPVDALKGRFKADRMGYFSRALVVFQLAISTALVTCMTIASIQMDKLKSKPLGFEPSHVVVVRLFGILDRMNLAKAFEEAVRPYHSVLNTTRTGHGFSSLMRSSSNISWKGTTLEGVENISCDTRFLETMDIRLLDGRNFEREGDAETSVIVNETLARTLGLDAPLGESIRLGRKDMQVIGVVRDFHFRSLHHAIGPAVLNLQATSSTARFLPDFRVLLMIRIRPENVFDTLDFLREKWDETVPDVPFDHNFLDEEIDRQYREEERWFKIAGYATFFAVFIACMGAFGLTSLTVARRTKEIGIRKVVGAPTTRIVSLLAREYVVLVGIASLIAWPATYVTAERWLRDFAYRVDPGLGTFLLGGLLMLLMVLLAVSLQVTRAARANPVDALRYE